MATMLEEYTAEEQRSVLRFFWAKGLNAKDIRKEMFPVYGGKCSSRKAVYTWVERFSQGRFKVADDETKAQNWLRQQLKDFYAAGYFLYLAGGFGVAGGVHRLWSHRTYKAKWPLRVILLICFSISGQNSVFDWVRDHRIHHKFSETDADPHNANRGFFFSHVGWLMQKKHPEVLRRGRQVDMSDVLADPLVRFHRKYFSLLKLLFCFFIPVVVPPLLWGEGWYNSAMGVGIVRYVLLLNAAWSVNSLAHIWGGKPYDREISPTENILVTWLTAGEGWHNYHHAIPWDYKAAELGPTTINWTTYLIEMFSRIGWAYDLKTPSSELIRKLVQRRGDGSHYKWGAGKEGTESIVVQSVGDKFQQWGAARELPEEMPTESE